MAHSIGAHNAIGFVCAWFHDFLLFYPGIYHWMTQTRSTFSRFYRQTTFDGFWTQLSIGGNAFYGQI